MFNLKGTLWLGREYTLDAALAAEARAAAFSPSEPKKAEQSLPRLFSQRGAVGIVTLRGSMVNTENFFTEMFGMTTYPAIREALIHAANDPSVKRIILDIESGGGQVAGVNDLARLVREIDAVKPVTTFSDGVMASAAYWIGSAASKVYAGETAIVGSIGVIMTHVSYAEALKKEGINVTLIRAGENKALGHPAEALSEKAREQFQSQADAIHTIFKDAVVTNRGGALLASKVDEWGEGNEFLGADAQAMGLIDAVSTFDKVFAEVSQAAETVDKSKAVHQTASTTQRGMQMKPRAVLDPKVVAAVAAGAPLEAALAAPAAEAAPESTTEADPAAPAAEAAPESTTEADSAAPAAEAASAPAEPSLVEHLQAQLSKRENDLVDVRVELAAAKARLAEFDKHLPALLGIARASVNKMTVALGGAETNLDSLSLADLTARHDAVSEDFKKAFKVGGVASTTIEAKQPAARATNVSPLHAAKIRAVTNK